MCRTNPITREHIEAWKESLQKRLSNPNLSAEQRALLQAQYDYVANNVTERPGTPGP
jgi:truncated hemoglobin YjbI